MKTKPKTKKAVRRVRRIRAWIQLYGDVGVRPSILQDRPSLAEKKTAEEYGGIILPCEIHYSLPRLTKKRK